MFHLIGQLLLGLAVSMIALPMMPGRGTGRAVLIAATGLTGALLGTFFGRSVLNTDDNLGGWLVSMVGALFALMLYRVFTGPRSAY
ncbi:MAG: GlsB/YeaQ/YmgE family stress response membrane protein [Acidobacteria bacterium]|nr:GlsB/YeaQ/YmgE family stress response membrane protein [Acidobacteriota bacterium]